MLPVVSDGPDESRPDKREAVGDDGPRRGAPGASSRKVSGGADAGCGFGEQGQIAVGDRRRAGAPCRRTPNELRASTRVHSATTCRCWSGCLPVGDDEAGAAGLRAVRKAGRRGRGSGRWRKGRLQKDWCRPGIRAAGQRRRLAWRDCGPLYADHSTARGNGGGSSERRGLRGGGGGQNEAKQARSIARMRGHHAALGRGPSTCGETSRRSGSGAATGGVRHEGHCSWTPSGELAEIYHAR